MSRCLPVALVQAEPATSDDLGAFGAHARSVLRRFPATQLLVYPELHLFGTGERYREQAEPLTGPRAAGLAELARDLGVWLLPGTLCEQADDGGVFNTAVLFGPDGAVAASYRKCFPWRPYEPYRPGTGFVVADLPGLGRIGLSICYDAWFPEVARQLAWLGAELIITPTQTTTSDRAQEVVLSRANAIANQVFVLSVNAAAPTGVGQSLIADPEGRVRVEAGRAAEVLTDVVDFAEVSRVREYGTAGLNRLWQQFRPDDPVLPLPAYAGRIDPRHWTPPNPDPNGGPA
jgi:predicted amidohydrolase